MFLKQIHLLFVFFLYISFSFSQYTYSGKVVDENNRPLSDVSVSIKETKQGYYTAENGSFMFRLNPGTYTAEVFFFGMKPAQHSFTIRTENVNHTFVLKEDIIQDDVVEVVAKSKAEQLREQAFNIAVINLKQAKSRNTDVNQIIKTAPGVNIREEGGLGSGFQLSLNGLTGNQVRLFLEGIPMDYFGSSMSMNNYPSNLIDQIEIYKGVVPVHLTSDALGGAINIVPKKGAFNFIDASISHASFNTTRSSVNAQLFHKETGLVARLHSFYNASDNNYRIDVHEKDALGNITGRQLSVERFHDAYNSKMIQTEFGVFSQAFADELLVGYLYSDNYNEIQQGYSINQFANPYAHVFQESSAHIKSIKYRKKNLGTKGVDVSAYAVYSNAKSLSVDTGTVSYSWLAKPINTHKTKGEINKLTEFNLSDKNTLVNVHVQYQLKNRDMISLNTSVNHLNRSATDKRNPRNATQFSEPSKTRKTNIAIGYNSNLFKEQLKSTVFVKHYLYNLESLETNYSGTQKDVFQVNKTHTGYGFASTYHLNEEHQLKLSYEKTIRYPEPSELFGDGLLVYANPVLNPEQSTNANLSYRFNTAFSNHQLSLENTFFLRNAKDYIKFVATGLIGSYENISKVRTFGTELTAQYIYKNAYRFTLNTTYQDSRNNSRYLNGVSGIPDPYYNDRIANVPYLFANGSLGYTTNQLFQAKDTFSAHLSARYVYQYYLNWPSAAQNNKSIIPTQFTQNLDLSYSMNEGMYTVSFSAINLFDSKVYDNLNQQRPGRSFSLKFRYFLLTH